MPGRRQGVVSSRALADLERIVDFPADAEPGQAAGALATILDAFAVLERHPLIGRPAIDVLRELVIGHGVRAMSRCTATGPDSTESRCRLYATNGRLVTVEADSARWNQYNVDSSTGHRTGDRHGI